MKSLIQTLLDRRHAYFAEGTEGKEILFNVNSMPDYGALSGRKLDEQMAGARVEVDRHKKNPGDFVLWKESGARQPGWKGEFVPDQRSGYDAEFVMSPENAAEYRRNSRVVAIHGRPGWHIECSAMSTAYLGNVFDIHGGGLDLIFPHHENEIAQSRCAHGTSLMANYWMHNGFLQVEGEKMSKSLGNFFTIRELLASDKFGGRAWPGEVLRLAMLKTHYRQPIDWTVKRLEEAHSEWIGFRSTWVRRGIPERGNVIQTVVAALCDDLNTHDALKELRKCDRKDDMAATLLFLGLLPSSFFDAARAGAQAQGEGVHQALERAIRESEARERSSSLDQLGISEAIIETLVAARNTARAQKDWKASDKIRDELAAMGIAIKDGKDADGKPVTTWEIAR
jgi:cysteinyl-tRNA synthetase